MRQRITVSRPRSVLSSVGVAAIFAAMCLSVAGTGRKALANPQVAEPGWMNFLRTLSGLIGPTKPKCTREPIGLANGDVMETETDLSLPGPTFGWHHTRYYNSLYHSGTFIQGERWVVDTITDFLRDMGAHVELHVSNACKVVFTRNGTAPNYTYTPPADFLGTLEHDVAHKTFIVTHSDTGEKYTFYDSDESYPASQRGLLKEQTDRYGQETITYGFTTDAGGRIDQVTTSQGWQVNYSYVSSDTNVGKIRQIDVVKGGQVLQRAKYRYYVAGGGTPTYCFYLGMDGDLVMVETYKRGSSDDLNDSSDSAFSIQRVTMYRY